MQTAPQGDSKPTPPLPSELKQWEAALRLDYPEVPAEAVRFVLWLYTQRPQMFERYARDLAPGLTPPAPPAPPAAA